MLTITHEAAAVMNEMVAFAELPEGAGVRIATEGEPPSSLKLAVTPVPAEDDLVVDEHGAHVFLEPEAAAYLDEMILDANVEGEHVTFVLAEQ